MKRTLIFALILAVALSALPASHVYADYRYDIFSQPVPAQSVYVADTNYNGRQLDIGAFKTPADLFVYEDSLIYVLDSGNNRIVVLNSDFSVNQVIEDITYQEEAVDLTGAKGIFVAPDGLIYVSDTKNARVWVLTDAGEIVRTIDRPASVYLTDDINFLPRNVVVDSMGTVYVISENSTQGAYMIDPAGNFLGFYGRNQVDVTADIIFESVLREFASEEQRARMKSFIPVEFANFDIDASDFIYTVTGYSETPMTGNMIRKLNPLGENILSTYRAWGDEPSGAKYLTTYVDVAVDELGFIFALDQYTGRVFMYDDTGFQVAIFGGYGRTLGTFLSAAAIDTIGDSILVLDSQKNNITVFEQTHFGSLITEGLSLYNQGRAVESLPYFEEITKMDANFFYAYYVMAEIYYDQGEYELSEKYAELSGVSQETYSQSKKMLRNEWLRENFTLVFVSVVLFALLVLAVAKVRNAKRKERRLAELTERRSDL